MHVTRCPLCRQHTGVLFRNIRGRKERLVIAKLRSRHPDWNPEDGLCERCLYLNEFDTIDEHFITPEAGSLFRSRVNNEFALLPTSLRLNADPRFTGRGITIAFIDSGFYPHPDLVKPKNRVRAIVDVTEEARPAKYFREPHTESWHGTMTSVAAVGNGFLSKGLYKGLAPEAHVVLIKVLDTNTGRINTDNITRGLRWAIDHKEEYDIRIISLSVGDDDPATLLESPVDQAAEEAIKRGIVVVAASGNNPERPIVPPASSPSVITIGGLDDRNQLRSELRSMYHSAYGKTIDGYVKPELIAPAIWVAGAILPKTDQFTESKLLFRLLASPPKSAEKILERDGRFLPTASTSLIKSDYKSWCRQRIMEMRYIAPYYKHIDGTSFAAPIISSLIAQMLQANPKLTPALIKETLLETAEILAGVPEEQQGHGVPNPRAAVTRSIHTRSGSSKPGVHFHNGGVTLIYKNAKAQSVALAGEFNGWDEHGNRCHELEEGLWSCWLSRLSAGRYAYKFVVDGQWIDDPLAGEKVPDGFGGWNSILTVDDNLS